MAIDFDKERARRTGEPMFIGCPECGKDKWHIVVKNHGEMVVPTVLVCASKKCNGKTEATITNGIIDN